MNLRKTGVFGGYGAIFVVIAVIMFATGRTFAGIIILLVGMCGGFGFLAFRDKFKGMEDWMEGGAVRGPSSLDEFRKRFAALAGDEAEKAAKEEVQRESRLQAAVNRVVAIKDRILGSISREKIETVGQKRELLDKERPEADKSLEVLAIEKAALMKVHSRSAQDLKQKRDQLKAVLDEMKKRTPRMRKQADSLEKDIAAYSKILEEGPEKDKKIERLKKLEEGLLSEKGAKVREAILSFSEAEKQDKYLTELLADVDRIRSHLDDDFSEKHRGDDYAHLQRVIEDIRGSVDKLKLIPGEHREAAARFLQRIHEFGDSVVGLKNSELALLRREHTAAAEHAEALRIQAQRRADGLDADLRRTEGERARWQSDAERLSSQLQDVNKLVAKWKSDLAKARELAKSNKSLESTVTEALSKNISEQADVLTLVMAALNAKQALADSLSTELTETKEKAGALDTQKSALETQKESNQRALETANEEKDALIERIRELKERTAQAVRDAQTTTEESVQQEKRREIEKLSGQLEEAEEQLGESQAEARRLREENDRLKDQAGPIDEQIIKQRDKIIRLERELTDAKTDAQRWKDDSETLERANKEQKAAFEERINALEASERKLQDEAGQKELEIIRLSTDLTKAEEQKDYFFRKADEAWGKMGSFESQTLNFKEANEKLQEHLKEEREKSTALAEARDAKARDLLQQKLKVMQLERLYRTEAAEAQATIDRLMQERKMNGLHLRDTKEEVKQLKARMKSLESMAADDATRAEMERLRVLLAGKERDVRSLSEKGSQDESMIRDALKRADDTEKEARRLLKEAESIEERHKVALAELKQAAETQREEAEHQAGEIEVLNGQITEQRRKNEGIKTELDRITAQVDIKEQEIMKALADKDIAAATQVEKEKAALLAREKELLDEGADTEEDLLKLTRRLFEATQRLFHVLESFRIVAEAESRGLNSSIETLAQQLEVAENGKKALEEETIPQLRRSISDLESQPRITPEIRAAIASTEADLRTAQEAVQIQTALKDDARRDIEQEQERVRQLKQELERLRSRAAGEKSAEEIEKERLRMERQAWFDEITSPARTKLVEAKMSAAEEPDEALNLLQEGMETTRNASEVYKNDFTSDERRSMDSLIGELHELEARIKKDLLDKEIASRREVTQPTVPKPIRVGVLTPFTVGEYKASVRQFDSPADAGKEVRWVALDYTKRSILFGRTQTHDPSKRDLKAEKCDVVITGAREDIVQISRNHLEIVRVDKMEGEKGEKKEWEIEREVYVLHYHGPYPVNVAMKNTNISRLKPGTKLKLEDGMKFFLDPEGSFGFTFSVLPAVNVERGQSLSWFKTVVDFSVKPPGPENLGYLMLPSHAKCAEELKGETTRPSDTKMVILNKAVKIGKKTGNDIAIDAQEDMERVVHEGGKLRIKKTSTMISANHALIKNEGGDYFVYNDSKEFGTFVNYRPVGEKQKLNPGDVIHFGENEPVFFVFGIKEFQPSELKSWDKYSVLFDNENFNCPVTSYFTGVISFGSAGVSVSVRDLKGNVRKSKDRNLLLNKHVMRFGKDSKNEVIIKLDPGLADSQGKKLIELMGDEHFMIRREFGHIYLFKSLNKLGSIMIVSGGKKMKAEAGNVCLFQSGDVVQLFDNKETVITFKLEQVEWKEGEYWQQAEIVFKRPSAFRRLIGG